VLVTSGATRMLSVLSMNGTSERNFYFEDMGMSLFQSCRELLIKKLKLNKLKNVVSTLIGLRLSVDNPCAFTRSGSCAECCRFAASAHWSADLDARGGVAPRKVSRGVAGHRLL
jgi:hypothetical protein